MSRPLTYKYMYLKENTQTTIEELNKIENEIQNLKKNDCKS